MKRVYCNFHDSSHYGRDTFRAGLENCGYVWTDYIQTPTPEDVLLIWNRGVINNVIAHRWQAAGARVLVAENGYLGKHWRGVQWYAIALGRHGGGGYWPLAGPQRWHGWAVPLAPWRKPGGDLVVLAQRGIGEPGITAPPNWYISMCSTFKSARVRVHPGKDDVTLPLERDLANTSAVITWSSGAALKALVLGIPVFYGYKDWIGAGAARHVDDRSKGVSTDDAARLAMFERLAWAQWTKEEVAQGEPFRKLLT